MIQENGGSWYIFNQGEGANSTGTVTVTYDEGQADGDGFCTYTHKFSTEKSLSNVHLLFGFWKQ